MASGIRYKGGRSQQSKVSRMANLINKTALFLVMLALTMVDNTWGTANITEQVLCKGNKVPAKCSTTLASVASQEPRVLVNCSSRNITNLSSLILPSKTTHLLLDNNKLTSLPPNLFSQCNDLCHLDFSNNNIRTLSATSFHLPHLKQLDLSKNDLDFQNTSHVPEATFQKLTLLEVLHIHDNTWENNTDYNDALFTHLINLRELSVDGIANTTVNFGVGFSHLSSLKRLYICGGLSYLGNKTLKTFGANSSLEYISMSSGHLNDMDAMAFGHFPYLTNLSLANNPYLGFDKAAKAWYGLQFTQIEVLNLTRSVPYETKLNNLTERHLYGLNNTRLRQLYLNGNNIILMNAGLRKQVPYLTHLSLRYNRLIEVANLMCDWGRLEHLEVIDMSHQTRRLYESENDVANSGNLNAFEDGCPDDDAPRPFPTNKPILFQLPPTLTTILFREFLTVQWVKFQNMTLIGPSNLKLFDFSFNSLYEWEGPLRFINDSTVGLTLDLGGNDATSISSYFFGDASAKLIKNLFLYQNKLGVYLASNNHSIFKNLTELVQLDLFDNGIKTLPVSLLKGQHRLKNLSLGGNALRLFDLELSHMTLERLDLSNNLLFTLSKSTRQLFDSWGSNFTLSLSGNPLECTCDNFEFMEWISRSNVNIIGRDTYDCTYHGKIKSFSEINHLINEMKIECSMTEIILGVTVPVVSVALIIALSFCTYRHKWEITFWVMERIRRKKYKPPTRTFEWDAFVSFQVKDMPFVVNQLIPNLEQFADDDSIQQNMKLCVHHRDFLAGKPITDNIYEAIQQSKKTIILLSKNFVESQWTHFELQTACIQSLDDVRDIIIVIILEEVPSNLLNNALLKLLQHNTYIEWPQNVEQQTEFWKRLREAMKKDVSRPVRCRDCAKVVFSRESNHHKSSPQNRRRTDRDEVRQPLL